MKTTFVILHYITIDNTLKCINSIEKMCGQSDNYNIVVVNNASPNGGDCPKTRMSLH